MEQTPTLDRRPRQEADDVERCSRARIAVLLLAGALVLLPAALGQQELRPLPPAPVAAPALAGLSVDGDHVYAAPDGVFVVPVVLRDSGHGLTDVSVRTFAQPVRLDPAAIPPREVAPGESRRFVVVLAPDCPTLRGWDMPFRASLLVRVVRGSDTEHLGLHLDQVPQVAAVVRRLCAGP